MLFYWTQVGEFCDAASVSTAYQDIISTPSVGFENTTAANRSSRRRYTQSLPSKDFHQYEDLIATVVVSNLYVAESTGHDVGAADLSDWDQRKDVYNCYCS